MKKILFMAMALCIVFISSCTFVTNENSENESKSFFSSDETSMIDIGDDTSSTRSDETSGKNDETSVESSETGDESSETGDESSQSPADVLDDNWTYEQTLAALTPILQEMTEQDLDRFGSERKLAYNIYRGSLSNAGVLYYGLIDEKFLDEWHRVTPEEERTVYHLIRTYNISREAFEKTYNTYYNGLSAYYYDIDTLYNKSFDEVVEVYSKFDPEVVGFLMHRTFFSWYRSELEYRYFKPKGSWNDTTITSGENKWPGYYSLPELLYLSGITLEEAKALYVKKFINDEYTPIRYSLGWGPKRYVLYSELYGNSSVIDFDLIYNERDKIEKIIESGEYTAAEINMMCYKNFEPKTLNLDYFNVPSLDDWS